MQLNFQVTEERLENLYSISAFSKLSVSKLKDIEKKEAEEQAWIEKQNTIIKNLKTISNKLFTNYDEFYSEVESALSWFDFKATFIKQIVKALSEHDDDAPFILDKKWNKQANSDLRDNEKIKLTEDIDEYFKREVIPYYPEAWMDRKKDKVGYEINFTKYFYKYEPPRDLEEIEGDIKRITGEIDELVKEEL